MKKMTVGELVFQQAVEDGYDPAQPKELISPIKELSESHEKIFNDLERTLEKFKEVSSPETNYNRHNLVVTTKNDNKIFCVKNDQTIHHYKIGSMSYNKNGLDDPKYIKMFRDIILYMPENKNKMRISEFEKLLGKNKYGADKYRNNLGCNAISFSNFLKKNGFKNIHSGNNSKVINVTDEYIEFNNKI